MRTRHDWSRRDASAAELMDDPACDPDVLARTYERFDVVNRVVSGLRSLYRRAVRPRLRRDRVARLLDIGTGGGDIPRRLLGWAARDGLPLRIVAIDPDSRAVAWASRRPVPGLTIRRATSRDLVDAGERFDIVMSNHVLHHLDDQEIGGFLADSERLVAPGGLVLHGDIERSRLANAGFAALTAPFAPNLLRGTYIRVDGLASIRRSRRADELARSLPGEWRVRRAAPFRLEVVREGP